MKNEILEKYRQRIVDFKLLEIKKMKKFLSSNKRFYLLEFGIFVEAYDVAIKKQAWEDFKKNQIGGSFQKFFENDDCVRYDKNKFLKVISEEVGNFQTSFYNERSKKIKNFNIDRALFKRVDITGDQRKYTLENDFNENFLPQYNKQRNKFANDIIKKYKSFKLDDVYSLAFGEIIYIANKKYKKDFVALAINTIRFLELCISKFYPTLQKDLHIRKIPNSLIKFRKNNECKFNTKCWRCGKSLYKYDNKHYCTRVEDRNCYEAKHKEDTRSSLPDVILKTENKCEECGVHASLNHIHKIDKNAHQFCGKVCYGQFKARYKKLKKHKNSDKN